MELLSRGWEAFAALVTAPDVVLLLLRLTIVAAVGHLALVLLRNASAAARHLVATGTLGALLLTPALGVIGGALPALRIPVPEAKPDSRAAMVLRSLDLDAPRPWAATPKPAPPAITDPKWSENASLAPSAAEPAIAADDVVPTADPVAARPPFTPRWKDWPAMLALAALLGALVMLARRQIALVATLWVAHRSRPVEDARIRAAFERATARVGVREPVTLALTELLDVPAVVAFPSPRLLLPAEALEWDDLRLAAVFVHELAHVQRRDGFGFAVGRLATALLWFHPLVWSLARAARQDCERACDDVVLGAGVRASDYADELLSIARGASPRERWSSMSLAFARPSSLEGRLLSILRAETRRSPVTRRSALAIGGALVLLLLPLATVRVVAEPYAKDAKWRTRTSTSSRTRTATVTRTGWGTSESASQSACDSGEKLACNKTDSEVDASGGEKSGDEWYEVAKSHYDAKEYDDAGDAYERAAASGYETGKAWYNAACSWSLAGKRNRAVGALHAAIDNGFDDPQVIASDDDFTALHDDRRFQLLVQTAKQGHPSEESDGVHVSHAKKDWKEWKNDKDLKDERDGQSLDDVDRDDPSELRSEGITLMRSGEPERAVKMFQRQYAVDSSSSALYNTACAYSIAHDRDRALMYLERAIYAGYNDAGHMRRDDDLRAIHDTRRFDELADLASDLSFNWPANTFDNSFVGPWRMMLPKLQRMTEKHPDAGPAWFNLGLAELRSKHPDASRAAYLRALSLGYRVKTSQYNLACAAAMAGDEDEAFHRLALSQKAGMDLGNIAPKDEDLEPLHDDPRWDSLMDRIDEDRDRDVKPAKYKSKFKS